MYCPNCGMEIPADGAFCPKCGKPKSADSSDSGIQVLIPYKNVAALIAYYLGVFSLIPCFPIGIAGLVLGIIGLKHAKKHPESKGKVHAWIGIIVGGFFGILYTVFTIIGVIAVMKQ